MGAYESDPPPQSKLRGDALAVTSQHPATNEKFRIFIYHNSLQILLDGVTFDHLRK